MYSLVINAKYKLNYKSFNCLKYSPINLVVSYGGKEEEVRKKNTKNSGLPTHLVARTSSEQKLPFVQFSIYVLIVMSWCKQFCLPNVFNRCHTCAGIQTLFYYGRLIIRPCICLYRTQLSLALGVTEDPP